MAKKRKASGRHDASQNADVIDPKGGRMGPITTYEDVADSEDEFHINRDKVMLDDGPDAKRQRKWQEEGISTLLSQRNLLMRNRCFARTIR